MASSTTSREWERINDEATRLKVYGGWMVCSYSRFEIDGSVAYSESSIFVCDPEHVWALEPEKEEDE